MMKYSFRDGRVLQTTEINLKVTKLFFLPG